MENRFIRRFIKESIQESMGNQLLYHGTNKTFEKFDASLALSGYGLDKHGSGYYLTDNIDVARFYAQEVSLASDKPVVLSFKLRSGTHIVDEDGTVDDPHGMLEKIVDVVGDKMDEDEAKDVLGLSDGYYGDHPSYGSFIDWAKYYFDDGLKGVSNFLHEEMDIDGLKYRATENGMDGTNYVIFNTSVLKYMGEV